MLIIRRTSKVISEDLRGLFQLSLLSLIDLLNRIFRSEFRKNVQLDKKDFAAIEYLLRKGQRQLEIYSAPGITNIVG